MFFSLTSYNSFHVTSTCVIHCYKIVLEYHQHTSLLIFLSDQITGHVSTRTRQFQGFLLEKILHNCLLISSLNDWDCLNVINLCENLLLYSIINIPLFLVLPKMTNFKLNAVWRNIRTLPRRSLPAKCRKHSRYRRKCSVIYVDRILPKPGNKCEKDEYKFIYASKLSMDFLSFFFTKFTRRKIFRIFPLSFF